MLQADCIRGEVLHYPNSEFKKGVVKIQRKQVGTTIDTEDQA